MTPDYEAILDQNDADRRLAQHIDAQPLALSRHPASITHALRRAADRLAGYREGQQIDPALDNLALIGARCGVPSIVRWQP